MRTDDLVTMLAASAAPVEPRATQRRFAMAVGWGAFGSTLLMAVLLGVRPDVSEAAHLPMFWVKLAFPIAIALVALRASERLSRPGALLRKAPHALFGLVAAVWLMALLALLDASPAERATLIFGRSWYACPFYIGALSIPAFIASLWAMKGLAPTRLILAGSAAGLLAGGVGASAYALYCDEMAAPFLAIWYVLGMLLPTMAGALVGRYVLRW